SSLYISSKGLLQADGCKGIALYNENYIELNMGHCTARISGDNLTLLTLSPGTLSIEGRLFTIEFFYT
ncbi:MAG: YabP/YqfC family sporulation protein, partial [Pygmaiobacter sp.]